MPMANIIAAVNTIVPNIAATPIHQFASGGVFLGIGRPMRKEISVTAVSAANVLLSLTPRIGAYDANPANAITKAQKSAGTVIHGAVASVC